MTPWHETAAAKRALNWFATADHIQRTRYVITYAITNDEHYVYTGSAAETLSALSTEEGNRTLDDEAAFIAWASGPNVVDLIDAVLNARTDQYRITEETIHDLLPTRLNSWFVNFGAAREERAAA